MKIPRKTSLLCLLPLMGMLLALPSVAHAQNNFDPDAVEALKSLVAKYQGMKSYSDDSVVIMNTPGPNANTTLARSHNVSIAWERNVGLRIEGDNDHARFLVRNDGQQIHVHWFRHAGADSDSPVNGNSDFLSRPMPGLPYDMPDIGLLTGGVSEDTLGQLGINHMMLSRNGLFMDKSNPVKCYTITFDYNDAGQRHITMNLTVGEGDGLLYSTTQQVETANSRYGIVEVHSNIQPGAQLPKEYWDLDFPLMGDAAAVADPTPLSIPDIVSPFPTITAQDVSGKTFTVSPDDKKTVLFFFFYPGGARYTIDEVQELYEEGEARGLEVVGVVQSLGTPANRTAPALQAFLAEHHVTFPVIVPAKGDDNDINNQLGNTGAASELIYGEDGKLVSDENVLEKGKLRAVMNSVAPIQEQ